MLSTDSSMRIKTNAALEQNVEPVYRSTGKLVKKFEASAE